MLPVSLPICRFRRLPFRFGSHARLLTLLKSGTMAGLLMVAPAWGDSSQQTDNAAPVQSQAAALSAGSRPLLPSRAEIERHQEFFLLLLGGMGIITVSLIRAVNRNRTLREALRRAELAESRLKTLLDNVGSYVYIKDNHYRYQYGNRRVCELFNTAPAALIGMDDSHFFGGETFAHTRDVDRRVIERGEPQEGVETHLIKSDGSRRDYLTIKTPIRDARGRITGLCGISTDITRDRATAQLIRQLEKRFSKIASRLPGVIFQVELGADGTSPRIAYVSENVSSLSGLSPDDLGSEPGRVLALIHPDDRDSLLDSARIALGTLEPWVHEYRIYHPDGDIRWLQVSALPEPAEEGGLTVYGFINDITRLQAEQDVAHELQNRLNKAALRVPGVIFQLDRLGDNRLAMPYVSDGLMTLVAGMLPGQLREDASPFLDLCHPDDQAGLRQSLKYALDHLRPWFHEFRIICPQGDVRWLRGSASPEASANNGVTAYGFLTDITEQQLAQQAVDELQNRFSKIASRLPGVIFQLEHHPDGHTLMPYASQGVDLLLGATDFELRSEPDVAFNRVHPEDRKTLQDSLQRAASLMQPWATQLRTLWPDDSIRWLRINATPDQSQDSIIFWYGYAQDITEEYRVESRLRETEEKLGSLYRLSPLGIVLTDMAGHFIDFNSAFENLFGYTAEQLKALDYWDVTPREYEQQEAIQLESIARSGAYGPYEKEYIRKDGSRVPVRLNGVIIHGHDGEAYIWSIIEDMTESRAILDELKRSNAELEQFAYAVSHDMRQPLRMISSYLQIMERTLADTLNDETRSCMRFAMEGARRMEQMILSLLEYSRVGRASGSINPMNSHEALEEALLYLGPEIKASGGQVTVSGTWPQISASHDEMTRLLQNLVGNALKYHPENVAPRIEVMASGKLPDRFRVEVRDNGIGIDPTQMDRLFQVFSRLQPRVRYDGVGVGLALCRKIVEHHRGVIGVTSEGEGKGSTFWFEIPVLPDQAKRP